MIASLHGTLESRGSDWVIIDVSGVGFQVYVSTSTLSTLGPVGTEVSLRTHLHLREDNATLYGFTSYEELGLFKTLIGVSGLGPRLALATLSVMTVEQVSIAIATASTDMLTVVPGIGKKMAERLILELKDKINAGMLTAPTAQQARENTDVISALTSLGYSMNEASRAVTAIPSSDLALGEKIRLALQYFQSGEG